MNQRKEGGGSDGAMQQAITEVIGNQGKSETLRQSRHNASLQVAGANYTKTKQIVIACAACIILTYLATSYVIINYGSMFWGGGDSIVGLQKQLKEIAENQSSCESVEKLAEATMEIAELENENHALIQQVNRDIFFHLRCVDNMTLAERAALRRDYAMWEELRANNVARENRIMLEQIIEELPPKARATWDRFSAQLKEDEESTIKHIKQECEMNNYMGEEESAILKETDGSYNN